MRRTSRRCRRSCATSSTGAHRPWCSPRGLRPRARAGCSPPRWRPANTSGCAVWPSAVTSADVPADLPPTFAYAAYAPFGQLLPRCRALVHHGGIGTCAQALRAGIPQLVAPWGFDQYDQALRVRRLGAGRRAPPEPHQRAAFDRGAGRAARRSGRGPRRGGLRGAVLAQAIRWTACARGSSRRSSPLRSPRSVIGAGFGFGARQSGEPPARCAPSGVPTRFAMRLRRGECGLGRSRGRLVAQSEPGRTRFRERLRHGKGWPAQVGDGSAEDVRIWTSSRQRYPDLANRHADDRADLQQLRADRVALCSRQVGATRRRFASSAASSV